MSLSTLKPGSVRRSVRLAPLALAIAALPTAATGQSITHGSIEGTVTSETGAPIGGARVIVTEIGTGVTRSYETGRDAGFRALLLPPGEYAVVAEQIGYRPKHVAPVAVLPGRARTLAIRLDLAQMPVDEIYLASYEGPPDESRAGLSEWFSAFELDRLPEERRDLITLSRLATISDGDLAVEGLPPALSGIAIDGVASEIALHPDVPTDRRRAAAFRLSQFASAELLTNPADVEWGGTAGATLSGYTRRGSDQPELRAFGDWFGSSVTSSDHFERPDNATHSGRGGFVLSGPIVDDTAHFVLGVEAQRLETPGPRAWEPTGLDGALLAVAADSFAQNVGPFADQLFTNSLLVSGFGRFDYQVTSNHAISARGSFARFERAGLFPESPELSIGLLSSLGSELKATDFSGGGSVTSIFGPRFANEVRLGVDVTDHEFIGTSTLATRLVDGGFGLGTDPALPGRFETAAVHLSETLHFTLPRHRLKFGGAAALLFFDQTYTHGRGGEFVFAGVDEFASLQGVFSQTGESTPVARFLTQVYSLYAQDSWTAAPGLNVLFGLRYDYERLDRGEVPRNGQLLALTGLDNTGFDRDHHKLSPRFGFFWDISQRGVWFFRGAAGVYRGLLRPSIFAEAVTHDGRIESRRGVGSLGAWPEAPGPGAAPSLGPRISLLGPEAESPRTGRVSAGVSHFPGDGIGIHLSGVYRHTDYLVRRHGLNLPLAPAGRDQYGRPVFGTLTQQGSLVAGVPGTNRRFAEFDMLSALDTDGFSNYWGGTFALERRAASGLSVRASYTFSRTDDNWLVGPEGGPEAQLTPFPDSLDGEDWADGRSDFDAPHRAVVGLEWAEPRVLEGLSVAALYRFMSGRPFTPGFRDGVDVNGDGSAFNDPAFVDAALPGMSEQIAEWDCLADQVGAFAERNACRGPDLHFLDARIRIGLARFTGHSLDLVVDGLNLLDTDISRRDEALLLIDRAGAISVGADGTVTLPLAVNPNFGEARVRRTGGRVLRFGLRLGL